MTSGRRGGGFGIVMLVVVMAVVLLLVSKAWKSFGSRAIDVSSPSASEAAALPSSPPNGASAPGGEQIRSSLSEAKQNTSAHTKTVDQALENE